MAVREASAVNLELFYIYLDDRTFLKWKAKTVNCQKLFFHLARHGWLGEKHRRSTSRTFLDLDRRALLRGRLSQSTARTYLFF